MSSAFNSLMHGGYLLVSHFGTNFDFFPYSWCRSLFVGPWQTHLQEIVSLLS